MTIISPFGLKVFRVIGFLVLWYFLRVFSSSGFHSAYITESLTCLSIFSFVVGKGCTEAQKKAASKPADRQNAPISYSENCESMTFANRTWQKREDR